MSYYKTKKSDKSGEYYFNLHAGNHEIILSSEGYKDLSGCKNGIESVQANGGSESNFDIKESTNNKFYFVLKARNGQVIGKSEMYESRGGARKGMNSVVNNSPTQDVQEA